MRIFFFLFIYIFIGCNTNNSIKLSINDKIIIPKHYIVSKTDGEIKIDGKDNEIEWNKALYTDDFIDIEGIKIPNQQTNVKMLWNDDYLYVFAKLYEKHIWGDITKRDDIIYYNNDFEVFINPNDNVFSYGELEINALGTEWDLYLNRPYRLKGKADNSWDIKGLKSAVYINGTLNDSSDVDKYWTVEIAIPLDEINALKDNNKKTKIEYGDIWRINFSRVNWDFDLKNGVYSRKKINGKFLPEYNWVWSSQGIINMHVPENWGFLIFSKRHFEYELPQNITTEQTLYTLFREIAFGSLKELKQEEIGYYTQFEEIELNNLKISCNFLKTKEGFEINASDGNINLFIDQSGKIKKLNHD